MRSKKLMMFYQIVSSSSWMLVATSEEFFSALLSKFELIDQLSIVRHHLHPIFLLKDVILVPEKYWMEFANMFKEKAEEMQSYNSQILERSKASVEAASDVAEVSTHLLHQHQLKLLV